MSNYGDHMLAFCSICGRRDVETHIIKGKRLCGECEKAVKQERERLASLKRGKE